VAGANLTAQAAATRQLEGEIEAVRAAHARDAATAADVLQSQHREQQQLAEAARVLERQLAVAKQDAAQLQRALQAALDDAAAAEAAEQQNEQEPSSELQRMLSHVRRQEERLAVQQGNIEALRQRLQQTEAALAAERDSMAALQVKCQSRSELRFIKGAPWLVHVARQRLTGAGPAVIVPGGMLAAVGRHLVLEAPAPVGVEAAGQHQRLLLHTLDLGTATWTSTDCSSNGSHSSKGSSSSNNNAAALVIERAVCSIGSKLLGFGGERGGQLLAGSGATQFLLPDLREWLPVPPPADSSAPQPAPRQGAALAYCARTQAAYLFGGQGEGGACLSDLWRLDLGTLLWRRLDTAATSRPLSERARTPCIQEAPQPCAGAGLAVSPDGTRPWLVGAGWTTAAAPAPSTGEHGGWAEVFVLCFPQQMLGLHSSAPAMDVSLLPVCHCCLHVCRYDLTLNYWAVVDAEQAGAIEPRAQ
jgi:hypothetical protein